MKTGSRLTFILCPPEGVYQALCGPQEETEAGNMEGNSEGAQGSEEQTRVHQGEAGGKEWVVCGAKLKQCREVLQRQSPPSGK